MIAVTVEFTIQPEYRASFHQAVLQQAANSLAEEGCHQFDVCFTVENRNICFLYEKYDNLQAFDAHLASDHFRQFDAAVSAWIESKTVHTWQLANESQPSRESDSQ